MHVFLDFTFRIGKSRKHTVKSASRKNFIPTKKRKKQGVPLNRQLLVKTELNNSIDEKNIKKLNYSDKNFISLFIITVKRDKTETCFSF